MAGLFFLFLFFLLAERTYIHTMPNPENIAGHKNSFSTSVKCGNWAEDQAGVILGQHLASHAPSMSNVTQYRSTFTAGRTYDAPKIAYGPRPIDTLDGHLVMAHGTNIIDRTIAGDHYLSLFVKRSNPHKYFFFSSLKVSLIFLPPYLPTINSNRGTAQSIKPQTLVDVTRSTAVNHRTDLIRKKAACRAAGFEPWDPSVFQMKNCVPTVAKTIDSVDSGAVDLGRTSMNRFVTISGTTLGSSAAMREIQPQVASTGPVFTRNSSFSSTFKLPPARA